MKFFGLFLIFPTMLLGGQAPQLNRVEAGHKLFQKMCSACHGAEAKGGRGPDLTSGRSKWGSTEAAILQNILTGKGWLLTP